MPAASLAEEQARVEKTPGRGLSPIDLFRGAVVVGVEGEKSHLSPTESRTMASWFSGSALSAGLGDTLNTLSSLKEQVKSSVEKNIDPNLIKNLTLMSDDLVSERKQLEEEELRKERVRDSLAEILPWQTRDAEMEILVDECKEAILKLSHKQETFTSPFVLSGGLPSEDDGGKEEQVDKDEKAARDLLAAEVSAEKLAKLQPLPTLLGADFDLDTHVGLVQRLLKEDENLVEMHSRLSSGESSQNAHHYARFHSHQ